MKRKRQRKNVKIRFGDVEIQVEGFGAKKDAMELFDKLEKKYLQSWKDIKHYTQ